MNNGLHKIIPNLIIVLLLGSCYNNSHIRTQRILEPGDKVISSYGSANLYGPSTPHQSDDIGATGTSGLRAGLSYMKYRKGREEGFNIAYGSGGNAYKSFILGYDLRKVNRPLEARPYRSGIYAEFSKILSEGERIKDGEMIQLRPYLMSTTSATNDFYGGIHGLVSFGNIESSRTQYYWDGSHEVLDKTQYIYKPSALGAGLTVGNEMRLGDYLVQTQVDLSYISLRHELDENTYRMLRDDYFLDVEPLNKSGPYMSLGIAMCKAPVSQRNAIKMPLALINYQANSPTGQASLQFDPLTGEALQQKQGSEFLKFDPMTGELIQADPVVFDPLTGLPVTHNPPHSLLSPQERGLLLTKGLRIISLNGMLSSSVIQDIRSDGITVYRGPKVKPAVEIIPYRSIRSIQLEGGPRGFRKGVKSAMMGCGVCIALPLGVSVITGESDMFIIGLLTAPAVGLGTLVFSSLSPDKYKIQFIQTPNRVEDVTYKKHIFTNLVKIYLESGFPDYQITQIRSTP
mgnify:CR=1 FL=1